jgi:hypothetical protein
MLLWYFYLLLFKVYLAESMADISHEADVICIPFCKLFTQLPESRQ